MKQYYKFLNLKNGKIVSEHGNHTWEIGKTYTVDGPVRACSNGFHASVEPLDALGYVKGDVVAVVTASGESDNDDDKVCHQSMTIVKAYKWTPLNSVALAIYCAEQVIKIYEDKYPNDSRPRDAIKAAKAYLKDPNKKNGDAAGAARAAAGAAGDAWAAAGDAWAAGDAAWAAARAARAARAAAGAAGAAWAAARAARAAAGAAGDAAGAAWAAAWAAWAAGNELTTEINRKFKSMIKKCEVIE